MIKYLTIFLLLLSNILLAFQRENPLKNDIMYFVFIDRFNDGNKDNNVPKWAFPGNSKEAKKNRYWLDKMYYANVDIFDYNGVNNAFILKTVKQKTKILSVEINSGSGFKEISDWSYNKDRSGLSVINVKDLPQKGKNNIRITYIDSPVNLDTYWGGDLQGVIDKLPYLHDMGITVIWLSPVFENVNGFHYKHGNTAYHGYWPKDFKRVEEHFINPPKKGENPAQLMSEAPLLKKLIDKAHAFDMKVLLDIPLNHTNPAPFGTTLKHDPDYFLELGALYDDGKFLTRACTLEGDKTCLETYNNSGWFHYPPISIDWKDKTTYINGNAYGSLPDLDQRNPNVKKYLLDSMKKWLSFGVDGFRLDAIKHIYPDYLKELEEELYGIKDDIIIVGEYFQGGVFEDGIQAEVPTSVKWLKRFEYSTMFDFSFAFATRQYFTEKRDSTGTPFFLETIMNENAKRNYLGDKSLDMVTFLNNHDIPRMMSMQGASIKRYIAALTFMFMSRGIPMITYGDEIALAVPHKKKYETWGEFGGVPYNRLMMDWKALEKPKYNDIYTLTKDLIAFRKKNELLRRGSTKMIRARNINNLTHGLSYLAMERKDRDSEKRIYYIHSSKDRAVLEFPVQLEDGVYTNPFTDKRYDVKGGVLFVEKIRAQDVVIITSEARNKKYIW